MQTVVAPGPIGAVVEGVELTSAADIRALRQLFYTRGVVCVRGQSLSPEAFLKVAAQFGTPDEHYLSHYQHPDHKTIMVVSNIQENGRAIGHSDAGRVWHSDGSYLQVPVAISMLYALEVPVDSNGNALGATRFASATEAYQALSPDMQAQIDGLEVVHRVAGRRAKTGTGAQDNAQRRSQPDAIHPLARQHTMTGRPYLFVNKGECVEVRGMDPSSGLALIDELADRVVRPEYQYVHHWSVGDVLIWDNQNVQHLATFDYQWPQHRRLMHRITITEGTEPALD